MSRFFLITCLMVSVVASCANGTTSGSDGRDQPLEVAGGVPVRIRYELQTLLPDDIQRRVDILIGQRAYEPVALPAAFQPLDAASTVARIDFESTVARVGGVAPAIQVRDRASGDILAEFTRSAGFPCGHEPGELDSLNEVTLGVFLGVDPEAGRLRITETHGRCSFEDPSMDVGWMD